MDWRAILAGVAFAAMWSSAFTSARVVAVEAAPLHALALRFAISGVLALILARAAGESFRLTRAQWHLTIVFGVCQNVLYLGANFVAMQRVEAGLAAIIAASLPLCVALASFVLRGERTGATGLVGLVAGILGVILIAGARLAAGLDPTGLALCLFGVIALTVATMSLTGASSGGNVIVIVGLQMLIGAAVLAVVALAFETPRATFSTALVIAFTYTTLIPGLAATLLWFWLVRRIGTVSASSFHFLNPALGVGIAALILGETLTWLDALGVAVITAGIALVQIAKRRMV